MSPHNQRLGIIRPFFCILIAFLLWGCAQLDHAGDVVLREVSSINVENPQMNEDMGALPEYTGEPVEDGKS